ncbi:hypothetical protein [Dechloromonas sp. H13]|uniref:hypothetical protein n=1 Tax=Dechloromonas sp. H13 TaxID=2570193 RepID=UPI0012928D09|nr:hypothetical protein [Dechloromonas sp. H13]
MRAPAILALLLSIPFAGCTSDRDYLASKHISQSGPLKVHPALLGEPAPSALQTETPPASGQAPASEAPAQQPPAENR